MRGPQRVLALGQLPRTPKTNDGPNFRVSKAPKLDDGGDCHQDRYSCHDQVQPARCGCLSFSGRLLSLDRDPQAVHGIAGGPLRDVVCHGGHTPSPASSAKPAQGADRPQVFRDRNDHGSWGRRSARPVRALHSDAINEPLTTALSAAMTSRTPPSPRRALPRSRAGDGACRTAESSLWRLRFEFSY